MINLGEEFNPEDFLPRDKKNGGPKWKSVTPSLFPASKLASLRSKLKKAQTSIDKINSTLEQAQSVVDLLAELESAITDPLTSIADMIIKELRMYIDNAASTGLYVLDGTSSYITGNGGEYFFDKVGNATNNSEVNKILNETLIDYDYASTTGPYEKKKKFGLNEEISATQIGQEIRRFFSVFRPTTYDEWIQNIADAFIDPYDLPDGRITNEYYVNRKKVIQTTPVDAQADLWTQANANKYNRPGAPQWGEASQSVVYVLAIVLPNVAQFGAWTNQLLGFYTLFADAWPGASGNSTSELRTELSNILDDATENAQLNSNGSSWSDLTNLLRNNDALINRSPISGGTGLDFYGVSAESLFPKVFNVLRDLVSNLEALVRNIDATLSGMFQDLLDAIEGLINFIKRLVNVIDDLLSILNTIATMDIKLLKVTSTKGVYDIYDKLLSATDFPDQENQKNQFIIGFAFAAGAPGPDSSGFDFGKYLKNQKKTYDEESGTLKDMYTGSDSGQSGINKIMNKFT